MIDDEKDNNLNDDEASDLNSKLNKLILRDEDDNECESDKDDHRSSLSDLSGGESEVKNMMNLKSALTKSMRAHGK